MQIIQLTDKKTDEAAKKAADVLHAGGVVLYPTDTLYGLGADAFSDEAVAKIYAIKGRDEKKPIHCIVADLEMIAMYAEITDIAKQLAEKFFPGPLTLIVRKKPKLVSGIASGIETIGFRIPNNEFCLSLAKTFGPYTGTSANSSGGESQRSTQKILEQLGERSAMIDLVIDAGELPEHRPSTVVDVSSGEIKILREGAISAAQITE